VLQEPEERYQAIEKAALADVFTARRLRHYFHNFTVIVMIDLPIHKVLQTPDIAGRLVRWSVEQSEFDIQYEPRCLIKSQVYTDFVVELLFGGPNPDPKGFQCILSVDGSFNQQGNRAGVILEGPNGLLIEESLKFAFKTSNNKAEYEALIVEMLLAQELGAQNLLVKSDSLLVTEQVTGRYQAKDPQLAAYLRYVTLLKDAFAEFDLVHVLREQNSQADILAKLASLGKGNRQKSVIQETLKNPRTAEEESTREVLLINTWEGRSHHSRTQETLKVPRVGACEVLGEEVVTISSGRTADTWITPYQRYLADGLLPDEPIEAKAVKGNSGKYTMIYGNLFRQ